MVNVSKAVLPEKHLAKLYSQLNDILSRLNETQADRVLTELLGHEERIMIAKRLAAIVLLHEGYSLYRISKSLKLSTSTIHALMERYHRGDFKSIRSLLTKDPTTLTDFVATLDTILHLGFLPRRSGVKDRWKLIKTKS